MATIRNLVLAALPAEDLSRLGLRLTQLDAGQLIAASDEAVSAAWFPETAVLSLVKELPEGVMVEAASVGYEGAVAPPLESPSVRDRARAFCLLAGQAWNLSGPAFRRALARDAQFAHRIGLADRALTAQLIQRTACNSAHTLEKRVASLLLMLADKAGQPAFEITQEALSDLLGVRRQSVSETMAGYAARRLVVYRRGRLSIVDPAGLAAVACSCHAETLAATHEIMADG